MDNQTCDLFPKVAQLSDIYITYVMWGNILVFYKLIVNYSRNNILIKEEIN